jgi:hypothetical protein
MIPSHTCRALIAVQFNKAVGTSLLDDSVELWRERWVMATSSLCLSYRG